jgi:2-methylisocitrate lyase-like PEP mutase family enzyme
MGVGPAEQRLQVALERAAAYAAAGADSLIDLAAIAELAAGPLPVAVMVRAGAATVPELASAGVVRISLGAAVAQAAYAVAARATRELLVDGSYHSTADGIPYDKTNDALASRPATQEAR